jgi:hypothetical protein
MFEHIECLVGQCGREFQDQGRECSVAPQRLEFRQVMHRTLAALAREFKPMVLVNPRGTLGSMPSARTMLNRSISFGKLPFVAA